MPEFSFAEEEEREAREERARSVAQEQTIGALRKVLLGDSDGKFVFEYLLAQMGLWSVVTNEGELALRNFAVELLTLMGVYEDKNMPELMNSFQKMANRGT